MRIPKLAVLLAAWTWFAADAAADPLEGSVSPCEVKRYATYSKISVKRAKKELRRALRTGDKLVWETLSQAKYSGANCRFDETWFTLADAEILAGYWGTDVPGAKKLVEDKMRYGQQDFVWSALSQAKYGSKYEPAYDAGNDVGYDPGYGAAYDPDAELFSAFASSRYHYCDARMLAELWGIDPYSAKLSIGHKVQSGDASLIAYLDGQVAQGRMLAMQNARPCEFVETNYSYDDAAALAANWRTDVGTAKMRIADLVTRGRDAEIRQLLAVVRPR